MGAAPFSAREVAGTRSRSGAEGPGEGSPRRPPAAAMRSLSAADRPAPGSARGGRARGRPRERPGRRGSPCQFRDGRGTRALIRHRRYGEAPPAREVLTLDTNFGSFSPARIGAGDSGEPARAASPRVGFKERALVRRAGV